MNKNITILSLLLLLTVNIFAQREQARSNFKGIFSNQNKGVYDCQLSIKEISQLNKELQNIATNKQALDSLIWFEDGQAYDKSEYTYNSKGWLTTEIKFSYSNIWSEDSKDEYSYYQSGYLYELTYSSNNDPSNEMIYISKSQYSYNSDWSLSEKTTFFWDEAMGN